MRIIAVALSLVVAASTACVPEEGARAGGGEEPALGPADGRELPGTDLDRVRAGRPAPDFSLASLDGSVVTLSDFRGERNVVLVFYRGHW